MHRFQNKYLKRVSRDKDSSMQKYFDLEKLDKMISKIRAKNILDDSCLWLIILLLLLQGLLVLAEPREKTDGLV